MGIVELTALLAFLAKQVDTLVREKRDPTPDEIAALKARMNAVEADWAAAKPKPKPAGGTP